MSIQVSHIDPGTPIKLYLYAENAKGTSDPAIIDDASLNQQKHYVEGKDDEIVRIFEAMRTLHRGGLKQFKKNTVAESNQMYKTKLACKQANKITWGYDN